MTTRSLRIERSSPRHVLARILDEPALLGTIQRLPPRTLGKLIDHVGLEDSGPLVALATTEQIRGIFDDDLWSSARPGDQEVFDAERFAMWLEVMLEVGEDFAAQKLLELPEDMVTLALHRHVLVLDLGELQATLDGHAGADRIEKALEGRLSEEFDDHIVLARRERGWDSIVAVLTAIDQRDHAFLDRVLRRCQHLSSEHIEDNGDLYDVLTSDEMLESDVAADREDERAREGFVSPSSARSFLVLCRTTAPEEVLRTPRDAVTRIYFRELQTMGSRDPQPLPPSGPRSEERRTEDLTRWIAALDSEEIPQKGRRAFALEAKVGGSSKSTDAFANALATLHERDSRAHAERMEELAYLANVLVSGCPLEGGRFRSFDAIVAVAAVCNLGMERVAAIENHRRSSDDSLCDGADKLFRVGCWILHREVALPACEAVDDALRERAKRARTAEVRQACERSAKLAEQARLAEKPVLARRALIEFDDEEVRPMLEGLLGDLPVLVGPLAKGSPERYRLDPHRAFAACQADLDRVKAFLGSLAKSDDRERPRRTRRRK